MTTPLIQLINATVRYNGGAPALHSLSLEIFAGERVALVGPSGAGKTTIIGLANATVLANEGRVEVLGIDATLLHKRQHRDTRRKVATVHQDFALVPSLRVAHNVAAGRLGYWSVPRAIRSLIRPPHGEQVLAVLQDVGIGEKLWGANR